MRKCLLLLLELDELISLGELEVPFGFELGGVLPRVEITGGSCIILMVNYKPTMVLSVVKYPTRLICDLGSLYQNHGETTMVKSPLAFVVIFLRWFYWCVVTVQEDHN